MGPPNILLRPSTGTRRQPGKAAHDKYNGLLRWNTPRQSVNRVHIADIFTNQRAADDLTTTQDRKAIRGRENGNSEREHTPATHSEAHSRIKKTLDMNRMRQQ